MDAEMKAWGTKLPLSKGGISEMVEAVEETVREGTADPAEVMVMAQGMKAAGDAVLKSKMLKDAVLQGFLPKFSPKEKPVCLGALVKEGGMTRYDYSDTEAWVEVQEHIDQLTTFRKQIEEQAKILHKNQSPVAYISTESGEEIEVRPAKVDAEKSSSGIKITLPK